MMANQDGTTPSEPFEDDYLRGYKDGEANCFERAAELLASEIDTVAVLMIPGIRYAIWVLKGKRAGNASE